MRISEKYWGIFKENVIGPAADYEYINGTLKRSNKILGGVEALGPGKVEHILLSNWTFTSYCLW